MPPSLHAQLAPALGASIALAAGALAAYWLAGAMVNHLTRAGRRPRLARVHQTCRRAWWSFVAALGGVGLLPYSHTLTGSPRLVGHGAWIALIATGAWLVTRILFALEDVAFLHLRVDTANNRRARKLRTQLLLVRKLTAVSVAIMAMGAALMTFPTLRALGGGILASAGVAGVVAGIAAQETLKNVFAGLSLAFSDALRLDDVVVIDGEWGRVEHFALTYVVLALWDERRLVLPTGYFASKPFQNWTRTESKVLGTVNLELDFTAPLEALRRETYTIVQKSKYWDGRTWAVQVSEAGISSMTVRVLVSAASAEASWELRCEVREGLIRYLTEHHPEALARVRVAAEPARKDARAQ